MISDCILDQGKSYKGKLLGHLKMDYIFDNNVVSMLDFLSAVISCKRTSLFLGDSYWSVYYLTVMIKIYYIWFLLYIITNINIQSFKYNTLY